MQNSLTYLQYVALPWTRSLGCIPAFGVTCPLAPHGTASGECHGTTHRSSTTPAAEGECVEVGLTGNAVNKDVARWT